MQNQNFGKKRRHPRKRDELSESESGTEKRSEFWGWSQTEPYPREEEWSQDEEKK